MRVLAFSFLLLFVSFLMTPTLVTLVKHDADVSYVFSLTEEEDNSPEKKGECECEYESIASLELSLISITWLDKSFDQYYIKSTLPVYKDLVLPPPELV